jgi:hypothetical protein
MDTIAEALLEAVMFIALREYDEGDSVEDYEAADVQMLENLAAILSVATDAEKLALADAVERAVARLPEGSEAIAYYRAWMSNMFGDEDEI